MYETMDEDLNKDIFDLAKNLIEINITTDRASIILNMDIEEFEELILTKDEDLKVETFNRITAKLKDELLLEKLIKFYNSYIDNTEDFLRKILELEDLRPRRMINMIQRWITLSNVESQDGIKILYIIVYIEVLYNLQHPNNGTPKVKIIIEFFNKYIRGSDKEEILEKVKRSYADEKFIDEPRLNADLSLEIFARMINAVRNQVVHEGNYWDFTFQPEYVDYPLIQFINIGESYDEVKYLRDTKRKSPERIYEISIGFNELRDIW